jgi:hypothetical protein
MMGFYPFSEMSGLYPGEQLTSGEAIFSRIAAQGSASLTSGAVLFSYWTAATSGQASTVITYTAGTAAGTPTYGAVGIYSVDSAGDLTLLASTGDLHATLWAATFTRYPSALQTVFNRVSGQRYAVGCLSVAATSPALGGLSGTGTYLNEAPTLASTLSGQSVLPASVPAGSLSGMYEMFAAVVQP